LSESICARCGTELPASALACPACATLRYGPELKALAADAELAARAGHADAARERWTRALALLPPDSQQYTIVQRRIAALDDRPIHSDARPTGPEQSWLRRGLGAIITSIVVLAGKLKFLLLGLTKASTFLSMFAFFGVYWSVYGWPLALGLVLSIYIHEMGHVSVLRRLGIAAGAPLFIPGVGALVMLRQHVSDPITDAKIGLAGPVWGLGAGLAAAAVYAARGVRVWLAIAELTGFINLFNLIPVWQLDGSRGFHALSQSQRWLVVAAVVVALLLTEQRMLFLVGGVAVWRAMQRQSGPGDTRTLATFVVLLFALSALARGVR
jgi:Zn-dependent protease